MNLFLRRVVRLADPRPELTVADLTLPEKLFIPMGQHRGPACEPAVEIGQEVAQGDLIGRADPDQTESAPIHAPCPGKVVGLEHKPLLGGQLGLCVVLEPSGPAAAPPDELDFDLHHIDKAEMVTRIAEAGIILSGSYPQPLIRDITPYDYRTYAERSDEDLPDSIYTLIVSALDREPGLYGRSYLAGTGHPALEIGLNVLAELANPAKTVVVGPKKPHPAYIAKLLHHGHREAVVFDGAARPMGFRHPMIKAVTGDEVPLPKADPRAVGAAFVGIEALYWAGLAAAAGIPQTAKWITVTSSDQWRYVALAPLGMPVGHVLESLGIEAKDGGKIVVGGLLSGETIYDPETPVTKEVDGILVMDPDRIVGFEPQPCIGCGLCSQACPTKLLPGLLSRLCEYGAYEEAESANLEHCIECGLCAYVCPAKRPMIHYFRHAKEELMARRVEQ